MPPSRLPHSPGRLHGRCWLRGNGTKDPLSLGFAEVLRAARLKAGLVSGSTSEDSYHHGEGRQADCLEERIRQARECVARM